MSLRPSRRTSRRVGVAAVSTLTLGLLGLSTPGTTPLASGQASSSTPLVIGSYNIEISQPLDQFKQAVDFIKTKSDVAGLQEAGGAPRRQYLDGDHSWRIYHPPNLPQDPVIWNPRVFEFVSSREVKLSDATEIESNTGGLMHWKALWAPIVHLRQISTGYTFSLINVHLVRAAVNGGRPRPDTPRTYRVYVHQVRMLQEAVKAERDKGLPVYVTGDFNVGYVADRDIEHPKLPYRRLTHMRMVANWQGHKLNSYGTHIDTSCPPGKAHCGAYIDQIWTSRQASRSHVYIHQVHSDHYPISSTYPVAAQLGYRPQPGTVGFAASSVRGPEWNKPWQSRQNPMVFRLQGDTEHGFVDVQVTNGTAVEGRDFTVDDSSLYDNDPSNDRVVVTTIPNTKHEANKTFTLTLVDPFDTTITQAVSVGTIVNDD
jgi:hypothetical protein